MKSSECRNVNAVQKSPRVDAGAGGLKEKHPENGSEASPCRQTVSINWRCRLHGAA